MNTTIPENITEAFSSATSVMGGTLSGAFDIQYRSWAVAASDPRPPDIDRGLPYAIGDYRSFEPLLLRNSTVLVEGLVVDTVKGGLGFRNHSVPVGFPLGAEWSEDITWIEPVTFCVDSNLTFLIEFGNSIYNLTGFGLIDEGGFTNLPRQLPHADQFYASQDLDLRIRAEKGAWVNNALFMDYFGVSYPGNSGPRNTSLGRQFPLSPTFQPQLNGIALSGITGYFLDLSSSASNTTGLNLTQQAQNRLSVTANNFTLADMECSGVSVVDQVNISNVQISCGYLLGAPQRSDKKDSRVFVPYQNYTQKLFVCASGIQASVKTVKFSVNSTASSLADTKVVSVEDKTYSTNSSMPLWAVERTNMNLTDIKALWGLVDDQHEKAEGLWTLRKEKLWLPAIASTLASLKANVDSLATANVPAAAMYEVYSSSDSRIFDYSGKTNVALNSLWQSFSGSAATAGNIVNLIYTDMLAAAVVGTRSGVVQDVSSRGSPATSSKTSSQLQVFVKHIEYNLIYAIPAFLSLVLAALTVVAAFLMFLTRRFSFQKLKQLLNQSSTGRAVLNVIQPELCDPRAPTKEWVEKAGSTSLRLLDDNSATVVVQNMKYEQVDHTDGRL
jgi:hypothetical protein